VPRLLVKYWVRGGALEQALRQANLTQGDLATALGVTAATVSRWKNGDRAVPPEQAARIAAYLSVPVRMLFREQFYLGSRPLVTYREAVPGQSGPTPPRGGRRRATE